MNTSIVRVRRMRNEEAPITLPKREPGTGVPDGAPTVAPEPADVPPSPAPGETPQRFSPKIPPRIDPCRWSPK